MPLKKECSLTKTEGYTIFAEFISMITWYAEKEEH